MTRVELVIDEPLADRGVVWPVTTGVPFPRDQLTNEMNCRLVDDRGEEQLLQSRVAATWDAERTSIRWLTIDFLAKPGRSYSLEFGPEIKRSVDAGRMISPQDRADPLVVTGALRTRFDSGSPLALSRLWLTQDGLPKQHLVETIVRDGTQSVTGISEGSYFTDGRDVTRDCALDPQKQRITVESRGPVRACVRVDSVFGPPGSKPKLRCRTRYHFFAGLSLVKVVHELRFAGSTKGHRFRDIGFRLPFGEGWQTDAVVVDPDGSGGAETVQLPWTEQTQAVSSSQIIYRHFGNPECRGEIVRKTSDGEQVLHESERVGDWLQVRSRDFAITGSLRWMWQQFPKEWEATRYGLTLHLWSPRGGELDFGADGIRSFLGDGGRQYLFEWKGLPKQTNAISNFFYYAGHAALNRGDADGQGINKHHEFWLHFGRAEEAEKGIEYARLAARQPLALATPEWNCSTDVFGPMLPRQKADAKKPLSNEFDPKPYEAIVDRLFDLGQKAQDDFGDYGWWAFGSGPHYSYQWDADTKRHYADPRRFEYHTYQKETQLWWQYFRTGERKFYDWAMPSEDHWVDIAVTHEPVKYQCAWRGGFPKKQTLHFRPGDWSIDSPLFYVRQRDSAEAWLRGCSQFQASYHRTLETTSLAYYLTGDERYNDVLNYWRDYWKDLAGKRSDRPEEFAEWFREQPWFEPTRPGEPSKSWAEMIRDYCPFTSGLRHQMTYFFSLATLYEHTWDPKIGQVLRECADAYLDPEHRIGVWRTQENGLPAYAPAPKLAHYWVPALWKYARATGDPRMPEIFRRYFMAAYTADPFREDVGQYSNVHLGYAYYFTKDRRHLRPALLELQKQLPNAKPLDRPEDLGRRIYNPYTPIQCFTAVPRLLWALDEAARNGITPLPAPPLRPQRTAIALSKNDGHSLRATLWGFDRELNLFGPDGKQFRGAAIRTVEHATELQPFDRVLPEFQVYLHELTIPADAPGGFYQLRPKLELAVLALDAADVDLQPPSVFANASQPVALYETETLHYDIPRGVKTLQIETADPGALTIRNNDDENLPLNLTGTGMELDESYLPTSRIIRFRISANRRARGPVWFRLAGVRPDESWLTTGNLEQNAVALKLAPSDSPTAKPIDPEAVYATGRFGRGLQITSNRTLTLPDHVAVAGKTVRLFDLKQGTIEFFLKRQWDGRLSAINSRTIPFLTNGLLKAWSPRALPLNEWAHVAVEWRPLKRDPSRQAVHIYIDGLDRRNYRSTWWEGYSQKPLTMPSNGKWLNEFVCSTIEGAPYVIDELRISTVARYADRDVELGGTQVFNPSRFQPPADPFELDQHTALLLHFEQNTVIESGVVDAPLVGRVSTRKE